MLYFKLAISTTLLNSCMPVWFPETILGCKIVGFISPCMTHFHFSTLEKLRHDTGMLYSSSVELAGDAILIMFSSVRFD